MDQLFINERELPPTPTSAQRLASSRDAESTAQGKSPEILAPPPAGEEENYQLWLGDRDASDDRSRQEHTRNTEPMSVQQGKSPEVLAPTPPASEEEAFQAWLDNEENSNRSQPKQREDRLASEQNAPGYSQRERQLALDKRLGVPGHRRPSQASSTQGPSLVQDTLVDIGDQNSSTLDIYDNGSDGGNVSRNSSPSVGVQAEEPSSSNRPVVPRRYSRPSRPYSGYPGSSNREGQNTSVNAVRQSGSLPSQIFRGPIPQTEVVVPRWQPDAEVTYCPICRTQFSFFVRKHHCRKCGRVVCNACSPHRITIPYQYIVHPPEDLTNPATRPPIDPVRARSSTVSASLGGGERVRLCNPCVPDPNIAPPQTRSDGQHIPSQGHSRSASTVVSYTQSRRGDMDIPSYQQPRRDSSLSAEARHNRNLAWNSNQGGQQTSSSYSQRDDLLRPELEARSRSSTVGSNREVGHSSPGNPRQQNQGTYPRPYNHLVPRSDINRPLPDTPHQQRSTQRRPIPEEDQCWVCYHELPSRELPNFQDLRDAHVMNCLENATRRNSPAATRTSAATTPQIARQSPVSSPTNTDSRLPPQPNAGASSSSATPTPAPVPSTPESRMLARERQHAAIVYGQPSSASSSSASHMSRVIPYIASEKDGIDDAECMVCLEDFEVGEEMGRLECFCRFHLKCIQGWFEKKPGKCPVHGVDG